MDGVAYDLVVYLVELQQPEPTKDDIARALGVSTAQVERYRKAGVVTRETAEALYDRVARGVGIRKPKRTHFEWPMDLDERSELARKHWKGHAA